MADEIVLEKVTKEYRHDGGILLALRGVSAQFERGELVAIIGPSGSGKTTLLNLLGGLDHPTSGEVHVFGTPVHRLGPAELSGYRRSSVGFVFQDFGLLPNLTALENVELPMEFARVERRVRQGTAGELLGIVGMQERADRRSLRLSGGEQQRVAIARALANDPPLILADEPTGNLDSETGEQIVRLLHELAKTRGKTVIVVTHDVAIQDLADRACRLRDGYLGKL